MATVYLSRWLAQVTNAFQTYVTYSLSVLVVRVSGVLPKRPMRRSFARSDASGRDDENAWGSENIRQRNQH